MRHEGLHIHFARRQHGYGHRPAATQQDKHFTLEFNLCDTYYLIFTDCKQSEVEVYPTLL